MLSTLIGIGAAHVICASAAADQGLVAHYTFEEGRGAIVKDRSGRGNHGKIFGKGDWVRRKNTHALRFNGQNTYVECPASDSLDVSREATVEIWFNPAARKGGMVSFHTGSGWADQRLVFAFSHYETDDSLFWVVADGNFHGRGAWTPPELHKWTHVALSYDGVTYREYRNGLLLNEYPQNYQNPDVRGVPLRLGVSRGLGHPYFSGMLGEVRVYNRAISAAEVFGHFAERASAMGVATPPAAKQLKLRPRAVLEDGKVVVKADVGGFRPLKKGMTLRVEAAGTPLKRAVPLDPAKWSYEIAFDAAALPVGDYVLTGAVMEGDAIVGERAKAPFKWRTPRVRRVERGGVDEASAFIIALDGKARATIVIAEDADKWARKAAEWLADYVRQSTGASLAIQPETSADKGNLISVGHTRMLAESGLTTAPLKYDGCRMVVRDGVLYLFGRDELQFDKEGAKGTCKAVVTFLEDFVGVRWYLPGKDGTCVPKLDRLAVSGSLDRTLNPAFGISTGRHPYGVGTAAGFANNYRIAAKVKSYGGHTYYKWLPEKTHFKEHPEYFAMIGGKRTGTHNHLCSSNADVAKILLRGIQKDFDAGYDWVALGQEDGYARCQCDKCEALDDFRGRASRETPCERLLLLHKWIADECRKSHPDKTVHLLVYGPTNWPSRKFDRWGDNVAGELTVIRPEIVEAWRGKVRERTTWIYWFDTSLAMGMGIHATPAEITGTLRYLHEEGFVGLYLLPETNWGLQGPSYYVLGKLMGDPYLNYRALQKEYCLGLFGPEAGATMDEFFTVVYAMPRVHAKVWPDEALRKLDALLAKAEGQAGVGPHTQWVRLTRDHYDFSRLVSRMLSAYSAYKTAPDDRTWQAVRQRVNDFEEYRHKVLRYPDAHTDRFFPGYDQYCRYLAGKYVGYYNSWKARRGEVLKKDLRGTQIGWGSGAVTLPLTLDFAKPPYQKGRP